MIIYSNRNLITNKFDVIRLLDKTDKAVYVSKEVYEAASVLSHRFQGDIDILLNILEFGMNHRVAVNYFYENAPKPLNILAPYLGIVDTKDTEIDVAAESGDIEVLYGVLHSVSNYIDFNKYALANAALRTDVTLPKEDVFKYKDEWERLIQQSFKEVDMEGLTVTGSTDLTKVVEAIQKNTEALERLVSRVIESGEELVAKMQPTVVVNAGGGGMMGSHGSFNLDNTQSEPVETEELEEEEEVDIWASLGSMLDDMLQEDLATEAANEKEKAADEKETVAEDLIEEPVSEVPKSTIEQLADLFGGTTN